MSEATKAERKDPLESSTTSSAQSQEGVVEPFQPEPEENELERTPTMLQRVQTQLSFFNQRLDKERKGLALKYLMVYAIMGFFVLGIFSIYWGTGYKRNTRYDRIRMLVVIEDTETVNGTEPAIGNVLKEVLETLTAKSLGNWLIQNNTEFQETADRHGNTIYEEVQRQIHHERYWAGIYVRANASYDLKNAILLGDTSYNVSAESIRVYYETGRDILGMGSYVTPNVRSISVMMGAQTNTVVASLMQNEDLSSVFSSQNSLEVATTPLQFYFHDGRPWNDPVLFAPSQVGLIYVIILTFFAFNFFNEIHQLVAKLGLKPLHLVAYRGLASVFSFFVLSLFYSLVTLAFQVDFTVAFGRSGFLVYWMTTFLTMWAVGAMNEVMAMWCIMFYPPLLGFWMLFWVIVNISSTFTPMAVLPKFYRYGYGLPIHASYEITKVIFFDTYKGAMGRNYGILIAWDAFATVALLLTFKKFGKTMGGRAMAARKQMKEEVLQEVRQEEAAAGNVAELPNQRQS